MKKKTLYIYGKNVIAEMAKNQSNKVVEIAVAHEAFTPEIEELFHNARKSNIKTKQVTAENLKEYIGHDRHQGMVAKVLRPEYQDLKEWLKGLDTSNNPAVIILAEIEDQNNFGAIIRSATAAGVSAIIVPNHHQAEVTAATYKTSAGNVGKLPLIQVANINQALASLKEKGFWSVALAGESGQSVYEVSMADSPMVFVIGNEAKGVPQKTKEACDFLASIPMANSVESLNASVSAAVVLYEWVRQRML